MAFLIAPGSPRLVLPIFISECGLGGSFTKAAMIRLASASGSGDRGMSKSKVWPPYIAPPAKHLHAVGVLLYLFNSIEETLLFILLLRARQGGASTKRVMRASRELSDSARIEFCKVVFSMNEKDPALIQYFSRLLNYYDKCRVIRNELIHSRFDPVPFSTDQTRLYIRKQRSRTATSYTYRKPSLRVLRKVTDKFHLGLVYATNFHLHLLFRGKAASETPLWYRDAIGQPLPEISPPPRLRGKSLSPHTPPLPTYLRRSPPGST